MRRCLAMGCFAAVLGGIACSPDPKPQAPIATRPKAPQENRDDATLARLERESHSSRAWQQRLTRGEGLRLSRVTTAEVDAAWRAGPPILLHGKLLDASPVSDSGYRIQLEQSELEPMIVSTRLRADLLCPRAVVDATLAALQARDNPVAGIAVAAQIVRVEPGGEVQEENNRVNVVIGYGVCVDAAPLESGL